MTSFRRYTWWALPGTAAAVLVIFVGDWVLDPDVPLTARIPCAVALAITAASSVVLLDRRLAIKPADAPPGLPPPGWLIVGCAGAIALGAIPLALRNYGLWGVAPGMMTAIVATFLPPRRWWRLIAGATFVAALPGGIVDLVTGDDDLLYASLFPAGVVAFTAWSMLGPLWAWDTAERLNMARRLSAELAVKDERLRFAADLHDIQGHHLQVIALKSELAARLAETDPVRATAEMEEIRRMAVDALQDTRAVVQGYRRTTLDDEIANATKVLAAADIDATMNLDPAASADRLVPSGRHLLGLVMREATTNVLRHSQARHAEVDYRLIDGVACLRVSNDGAVERSEDSAGSGLRTLTERLRAAGGELTWERDGDRFVVAASFPTRDGEPR
jgi:two-component system sensor histidine kinase DesK